MNIRPLHRDRMINRLRYVEEAIFRPIGTTMYFKISDRTRELRVVVRRKRKDWIVTCNSSFSEHHGARDLFAHHRVFDPT